MTPSCYIALGRRGDTDHPIIQQALTKLPRAEQHSLSAGGWRITLLLGDVGMGQMLPNGRGIVIGPIFERDSAAPPTQESLASSMLQDEGGSSLVTRCWGDYVAFIVDTAHDQLNILRAPWGRTPCYFSKPDDMVVLASHADLIVGAGLLAPSVDRGFLADHLRLPDIRTARTGIEGLKELLGGSRMTLDGEGSSVRPMWSPSPFMEPAQQTKDFVGAAAAVRGAVMTSTRAWANVAARSLLTLSGGLDSSIVATCLSRAGADFSCLTLATDDPTGDEQVFAQAVAHRLGVPLRRARFDPADVDLLRSDAAHLPRPLARSFGQAIDRATRATAAEVGAGAFFDGGGGDNVFCHIRSATPLADRLLLVDAKGAWRTLNDICRLTDSDYRTVIRLALAKLSRGSRSYRWKEENGLLNADLPAVSDSHRPRFDTPATALPGSAAHLAVILGIENYMEGHASELSVRHISPLLAQPVIEACLAIPSWFWCRGGVDRAVARAAFADDLPRAVVRRVSKGTPDSFCAQIVEAQRDTLRDMLADGLLSQWGILDREAVLASLVADGPFRGSTHLRLLALADAEAWARTWTARPSEAHG